MRRINEINYFLDDWEEEAAQFLEVGPVCKDDLIKIQEHIISNHQSEIEDFMDEVEKEQCSNGSDVDDYTTQEQKDNVLAKTEALQALHDRLFDML